MLVGMLITSVCRNRCGREKGSLEVAGLYLKAGFRDTVLRQKKPCHSALQ